MNIKLLASCIATAWVVTGCGGSGSDSDPISSAADSVSEATAASSSVSISAAFPESAQAAAIDANAESISISFLPSEAGSIEEAIEIVELSAQCLQEQGFQDWSCLPEDGPSVGEALLTAGSPSVSLDLVPGKYRVEAFQFDTINPDFETTPISATSSFVTLTEGEHNIELNLVHATWTNETSFSLQLLNQPITDDTDTVIDVNPDVDGDQTIADLLELTDQPIIGMHIVGLPTFDAETDALFDNAASSATAAFDEFDEFPVDIYGDPDETIQELIQYWVGPSLHIPVIRQGTTGSTETVAWWFDEPYFEECNVTEGETTDGEFYCAERGNSPALLLQEYQATGGNSNTFNLGEMWAEFSLENEMGMDEFDVEGGLATVPFQFADPTITTDGTTVTLDWGDGFQFAHVHSQFLETLDGEEEAVFLDFETESGTTTFADDTNSLEQVDAPTVTGGTTITGTVIEFLFQFSEVQTGANVPEVPDTITPDQLGDIDPVTSAMAAQAAAAAGLTAQSAATDNGTNCSAINELFSGVFVKYIWNETSSTWEGGTWNYTYFLEDTNQDGAPDTVSGEDWNGDGTVDQFEVGVFENWTCTYDDVTQQETCEDLDGVANDDDDKIETVPTGFEETGTGEYCLHAFSMTAGQLNFSFSDLLSTTDVVIQTDQ